MVINDCGELLSLRLTAGNVDDRQPVEKLVKEQFGNFSATKTTSRESSSSHSSAMKSSRGS
jgi:hypothetical protein